ncbi:hypothetical protein [Streptomyces sp. NPDC018610]|uniref:hypothetical protein n=1 Tax=Streptomyces sp. NPDC018610 TaxID=3365049 RepID=UPI00378D74B3
MENPSPLPPNVPPRPSGAPTVHMAADSQNDWRDEYENDPEYQAILSRMETPWWRRPAALWGGVVAVAVGSFFLGGAVIGSDGSSGASPDPWVQGQTDNQPQNLQQQNNQPAGVSAAQKFQILTRFCSQQAGGPTNVDEAALMQCKNDYYVTDQGQVLPK